MFKRTEGVSTTGITGKLLALAEHSMKSEQNSDMELPSPMLRSIKEPPKQQFL